MDIKWWEAAALRYKQGLNYVLRSNKLIQLKFTNTEVEEVYYLIKNGYKDYFDLLIFSTAFIENLMLVTEDDELRRIPIKFKRYENMKIIGWDDLIKSIK